MYFRLYFQWSFIYKIPAVCLGNFGLRPLQLTAMPSGPSDISRPLFPLWGHEANVIYLQNLSEELGALQYSPWHMYFSFSLSPFFHPSFLPPSLPSFFLPFFYACELAKERTGNLI